MRSCAGASITCSAGPSSTITPPSMKDDTVGDVAGERHLMRHHDHGGVLCRELLDTFEHLAVSSGSSAVVGSSKTAPRVHDERAGNARTLLLAAGKLAGHLVLVALEAHFFNQVARLTLHFRA